MLDLVVDRWTAVRTAIARAARDVERDPDSVTLIAVSKTYGEADIEPVIVAGQRHFGENRVQEAKSKWPALRARHPDVTLHLIGPLQSNKAAEAVALFDCIHTVDRPKIAHALADEMRRQSRHLPVFVQVNTGAEPQKAGVLPAEADDVIRLCRDTLGLSVAGLMCIPPVEDPPSAHFALLAQIAKRHGLPALSMGMSGDFAAAIQMGATHVRIGSAIFGARG
jgi:hypothetical protein